MFPIAYPITTDSDIRREPRVKRKHFWAFDLKMRKVRVGMVQNKVVLLWRQHTGHRQGERVPSVDPGIANRLRALRMGISYPVFRQLLGW